MTVRVIAALRLGRGVRREGMCKDAALIGALLQENETASWVLISGQFSLSKVDESARRALKCRCRRPIPTPNRSSRPVSALSDPRRTAGTKSARDGDHRPPDGSGKLCVFVFHIGASQNETSLRPSAPPRCIRGRFSTLPITDF